MRAIVDADNLPTAVRYYTAFGGEPAQQLKDYISIDFDKLNPVHHLTLESLLRMLDTTGEREYMIVVHSNPNGLVLPVGAGMPANADRTVLNVIQLASIAFGLLDDDQDSTLAKNAAFVNAWTDFFAQAPNVNTASMTAASGITAQLAAAAQLGRTWVGKACASLHVTEARLRELAALADKVRRSDLARLEFRSCRLGAGSGLKEVASFFGAYSYAPTVRTFYVHQPVQFVASQARLNQFARRLPVNSRRFTAAQADAGPNDDVAFAIQVDRLQDHRYSSHMFAITPAAVLAWVNRFIIRLPVSAQVNNVTVPVPTGRTLGRDLVVAGFWTPGAIKPFVFPGEPEYPRYIEGQAG
jgi:hypothetical protein